MKSYDYGTKKLKANSSVNGSFGKVHVTTTTERTNDSQMDKLKNKTYYRYSKGSVKNSTRPKTF